MSAPRGEAARRRIIAATSDLILDQGLAAFNVEAVAAASGSARSTIYRHWPEPRDLLVDALASMGSDLPTPDTGTLETDLVACAELIRPLLGDPRTRRLLLDVTREAADDPDLELIRLRLFEERRQPMRLILQRAIARGEIDADIDLRLALNLVEGALLTSPILQNLPLSDDEIAGTVRLLLDALG